MGTYAYSRVHSPVNFAYYGRNYQLFSLLADVRNENDIEPLDDPRGVPFDLSDDLEEIYQKDDGCHSHSYFGLNELLEVGKERFQEAGAEDFLNRTIPILESIAEGDPDSVRFVFWFDS